MKSHLLVLLVLAAAHEAALADPQLSSWVTGLSTKYARIYTSDANKLSGVTATTWTSRTGQISQSQPAYVGIQLLTYSSSWIYLTTNDLGPYIMGPWYDDASRTTQFINLPKNQNISYRIPRTSTLPAPPTTKTATAGAEDAIGYFVDGVAMFDPTDGFSYANGTEASPGTGQWHRDAYVNEYVTFDPGYSHQQNTGKYHNHANPLALRYLLGDHVDFNSSTKLYSESTSTPTAHSPIIAWARDGYPVYGPNGYSSAMNASSGIRRMIGGFVLRDGTTGGVDNISTAGRTLPAWVLRNNGNVSASGPSVSSTYPLGRYIEDSAYLGDLTKPSTGQKYVQGVDFDLNEYNVRYCVTPEFPTGTYAYFLNVSAAGTPQFPYCTNRYFFGNPTGGTATASETVTTYYTGVPNFQEVAQMSSVNTANGNVSIVWSSVEGGTYKVEASPDLSSWTTLTSTQAAASNAVQTSYTEGGAYLANTKRFYRTTRLSLAAYDTGSGSSGGGGGSQGISSVSPTSGTHGSPASLTITLNSSYNPAPPPNTVQPTGATLTKTGASTISASSYTRNTSTGVVTAVFSLPSGATLGAYTVNVLFGPNTWSLTDGFTVN